ncbi:MAG: type III-A CRISPR-associated RAMP protein Csm5 [Candidatus Aenigmarchaeota archaeon]|nr:type III-A CRISPR-associated RAMP protein Csm5 [Candidatus Aenigmarchaeota archaeon]
MNSITPIHISSGESFNKLEYMKIDDYLHIFDLGKIIDFLIPKQRYLGEFILKFEKNFSSGIEGIIKEFNIKKDDIMNFLKYRIKADGDITSEVFTFIRHSNGRIYIPGSSIKGAMRKPFYGDIIYNTDKEIREKIYNFNKTKNIEISDIEGDFESQIKRIKRLGMGKEAKLENREVISFKNLELKIKIDNSYDIENFIYKINNFYIMALEYMIKKSYKYDVFNKNLKNILKNVKNNIKKSLFLHIGFGGGFYTKSLGVFYEINDPDLVKLRFKERKYLIKGHTYTPFPKTFVSSNEVPLGWVKLDLVN